jgi:hypothetical protein
MSLENDMVNAELMLAKLKKMAKGEGLSMHNYILKNGENIENCMMYMKTMEFMTFYTTKSWMRGERIVMVLGLYLNSEIESMIKKEPLLIHKTTSRSSHNGAVYLSAGGSDYDPTLFSTTTASDGWGRYSHVVKHQIHLNKTFINWIYRDPLEVKE